MEDIYKYLIKLIDKKIYRKDVPIACVIVDEQNNVVCWGVNTREKCKEISGHAEIMAINKLIKMQGHKNLSKYKMIITLEPCKMCVGAIEQAEISEVSYFVNASKFESKKYVEKIILTKIEDQKKNDFFSNRIKDFFKKLR